MQHQGHRRPAKAKRRGLWFSPKRRRKDLKRWTRTGVPAHSSAPRSAHAAGGVWPPGCPRLPGRHRLLRRFRWRRRRRRHTGGRSGAVYVGALLSCGAGQGARGDRRNGAQGVGGNAPGVAAPSGPLERAHHAWFAVSRPPQAACHALLCVLRSTVPNASDHVRRAPPISRDTFPSSHCQRDMREGRVRTAGCELLSACFSSLSVGST